jgi:uncharacterized membrane protein HdeD (DUF308 family)
MHHKIYFILYLSGIVYADIFYYKHSQTLQSLTYKKLIAAIFVIEGVLKALCCVSTDCRFERRAVC